jgi:geranylgeranyl diphosphate synthase, type I
VKPESFPASEDLKLFLDQIGEYMRVRLHKTPFLCQLGAGPIKDRLLDYLVRGGKNIRPAMTCLACGALGGEPEKAIDVGIAIEMTHTWTLVHDDIIDRDETRRGGPSVHARIRNDYKNWGHINPGMTADHLGLSMALLVGDAQHAMAIDILSQAALAQELPANLVVYLIAELEGKVLPALLSGEVDDVFQTGVPLHRITREEILLMLERKTAALLTFAVVSGGLIGLGKTEPFHPSIHALRTYGNGLGIAFQLHDDLLGITGNEPTLGKPVGSDFKEGKRTLAVKFAWDNANHKQQLRLEKLLGKPDLSDKEIDDIRCLLDTLGALKYVEKLAAQHVDLAINALNTIPKTLYRTQLENIAKYTIERNK